MGDVELAAAGAWLEIAWEDRSNGKGISGDGTVIGEGEVVVSGISSIGMWKEDGRRWGWTDFGLNHFW